MTVAGINVIGCVSGNLGLGVAARQLVALALHRGIPVATYDADPGHGRGNADRRYDALKVARMADLPHRINVFVVGLVYAEDYLSRCPATFFTDDYLNVVVCFWELPVVPRRCVDAFRSYVDVVVGVSAYMRHTFSMAFADTVVIDGVLPVLLPPIEPFDLRSVGVPPGATTFVASYEPLSDTSRKNPHAVIDAFLAGSGELVDAWLLLRLNNARDAEGALLPAVRSLLATTARHPRVRVLTEPMSYPQVLGLYAACDAYVSLHRAEGLGLGIAEAMALGRAVIATGWSGNLEFMDRTNSFAVDHALVPVRSPLPAYRDKELTSSAVWAEPVHGQAAALMRLCVEQPERREAMGHAARRSMEAFNERALQGRFLDELQSIFEQRAALALPRSKSAVPPVRRRVAEPLSLRVSRKLKRLFDR